jgi:hypothetical protein
MLFEVLEVGYYLVKKGRIGYPKKRENHAFTRTDAKIEIDDLRCQKLVWRQIIDHVLTW